jgi:hypothetical protein
MGVPKSFANTTVGVGYGVMFSRTTSTDLVNKNEARMGILTTGKR